MKKSIKYKDVIDQMRVLCDTDIHAEAFQAQVALIACLFEVQTARVYIDCLKPLVEREKAHK